MSRTDWRLMHAFVLIGFTAVATFAPALRIWPLLWLAPLIGYASFVAVVPPLRATFGPWRFGRVSAGTVTATAVSALGSCGALITFHFLTHPDVSAYAAFLPVSALGGVLTAGVLFSVFN